MHILREGVKEIVQDYKPNAKLRPSELLQPAPSACRADNFVEEMNGNVYKSLHY